MTDTVCSCCGRSGTPAQPLVRQALGLMLCQNRRPVRGCDGFTHDVLTGSIAQFWSALDILFARAYTNGYTSGSASITPVLVEERALEVRPIDWDVREVVSEDEAERSEG